MLTFITVPTDLVATISTNAGGIFTDLLPIAVVVIGVSLGVFVLNWAISKFKTRGAK